MAAEHTDDSSPLVEKTGSKTTGVGHGAIGRLSFTKPSTRSEVELHGGQRSQTFNPPKRGHFHSKNPNSMSFIRRSQSFLAIPDVDLSQAEQLTKGGDVSSHNFFYNADDISLMSRDWGDSVLTHARIGELGGIQGLAVAFRSDIKHGLLTDEVDAGHFSERRNIYGANVFIKAPPPTFLELCMEQLGDPMLIILMIAGAVSLALGIVEGHSWVEGLAILMAVAIVTLVGAGNDYQKEKQFRAMDDKKDEKYCVVLRGGKEEEIPFTDVNVGDLVVLRTGFGIPCDGVYLTGTENLKAQEASMTGESRGISKDHERNYLLAGTEIVDGEGMMLASAVGQRTAWGQLLSKLSTERPATPLQAKLDRMANKIGVGGGGVAVVLFFILFFRWLVGEVINGDKTFGGDLGRVLDFFIIAVTIVVVAVPEGLPLAVTISLAYSMKKMVKDNNFVRVLSACETMGNATTICSDKTGTLTQNVMTVTEVFLAGQHFPATHLPTTGDISPPLLHLINEGLSLNSKVFVKTNEIGPGEEEDGADGAAAAAAPETPKAAARPKLIGGNETECALLAWALVLGADYEECRGRIPIQKAFPFSSKVKRSSVLVKIDSPSGAPVWRMYLKGAAERVIEMCTRVCTESGDPAILDTESRDEVLATMQAMMKTGLRCIGVAYRDYDSVEVDELGNVADPDFDQFVLIAVTGIKDPVRPEVPEAVRRCQNAGIIVRMVTGDHIDTAKFIARECGILKKDDQIAMMGPEFRQLTPEQMDKTLPKLRVLARSTPDDKERLVMWYKTHGHVVAVTGDGANDALALKEADVGLSMGIQGTDVAKEASDIIIMDDNFASIVKTVMWGRSVYDNIRKFVQFQLTVNVVALTVSLLGAMIGFENPLTAVQLLWVNLIMDSMAALALGTEMPTMALLDRRPYMRDCSLISPLMWRNIFGQSALQLVILIVMVVVGDDLFELTPAGATQAEKDHADMVLRTMLFNTFVFLQIFNEFNSRKVNNEFNIFERIFDNAMFPAIIVITCILQMLMVEAFGDFAQTVGLSGAQWLICVGLGSLSILAGFAVHFIPVDMTFGQIAVNEDGEILAPLMPEMDMP